MTRTPCSSSFGVRSKLALFGTARNTASHPDTSVSFGWKTQDLNLAGAAGNAANADGERGRLTFEAAAQMTAETLQEIDRLPLSTLQERGGF